MRLSCGSGVLGCGRGFVVKEDVVDAIIEDARQSERNGQTRVVAARLDRVDRLATDTDQICEVCLAPLALGTQHAEAIVHVESLSTSDRDL